MIGVMKKWMRSEIEKKYTITLSETYGYEPQLFSGKTALIIGGTGDIGNEIANRILMQGGNVVVTGRAERLSCSQEEKIKFIKWDISNLSNRKKILNKCVECFGKIDIWINCAGYISDNDLHGDFWHATEDDWDKQMTVNGKALYFLTQEAAKYFKESKTRGRIVQILSIGGIRDTWQPYGISKRVSTIFTEEIAKVLFSHGILVFGVAPGEVKTKMINGILHGKTYRKNGVPDRRLASKEEVANLVSFLVSGKADCLSGRIIVCDGGDTLL